MQSTCSYPHAACHHQAVSDAFLHLQEFLPATLSDRTSVPVERHLLYLMISQVKDIIVAERDRKGCSCSSELRTPPLYEVDCMREEQVVDVLQYGIYWM